MDSRVTIDVICLQSPDITVGQRLDRQSETLAVETVTDETAVELRSTLDCLVVSGDGSISVLAGLETGSTPVVAFVPPGEGVVDRALEAGATDVVTAAGPNGIAVLAHRIERAVDRGRAVSDLRETRERFDALAENAGFVILTIDGQSVVRYASPTVEDVFGYAPETVAGKPLGTLLSARCREQNRETVEQLLAADDGHPDQELIEMLGQRSDGTEFPVAVSINERSADDRHRFSVVIRNISDERARQGRLDEMASAIEGSMDGIALLDEEGRFRYVNDAHLAIYGYDEPDTLLGEAWHCLYGEDEIQRFESEIMPTVHAEGRWRGEATGRTADGDPFPQELTLTELDDGGLVCVVRDISDRVERRKRLREEQQFVETVIDTLPDVFYVVDTNRTFSRWNDRFETVTGYSGTELDGMEVLQVVDQDDREAVEQAIRRVIETGESETLQAQLLTRQGNRVNYELSGSRITDADGETVGLAGIGRDVTGREFRRQRLAVLSRVLRHNVRNRTMVIQGQAEHVREQVTDASLDGALERIESAADEMAATSERARQAERILRDGTPQRRPIDLTALVDDAVESIDTDGMAIERDLPASVTVVGTPSIEAAVAELLKNVRSHVSDPTVRISVEPAADETVSLVIADDGPGIPPHEQRALTDGEEAPLSHGTGLGLWLVRWIAIVAGGHVTVRDSDLGGSAVVLSFSRT